MKSVLLALAILFAPLAGAHGQTANDLVVAWLAVNGKTAAPGDYSTCQPPGGADQVCSWNTGSLGAQPTADQLASLAPAWTNQQQAAQFPAIIRAGVTVTSSGTPSLTGKYKVDDSQQAHIAAEVSSILLNGTFTNKQATRAWPDYSGVPHTFTTTQFETFATEIGLYVDQAMTAYETLLSGQPATWPLTGRTIP